MIGNGYVLAYRRAWEHPIFRDLLDAAIWNYLYQNAAWKDGPVYFHGTRIDLKRGQIFVSLRELSLGFCCAEARIRRLTKALTGDAMIDALPTHRGTIITICNYEEYQIAENTPDALKIKPATRKRRTADALYNNDELKNQDKAPPIPPLPDWLDVILWEAFKEMRRGKKDPMTIEAERLMLLRLDRFRQKGHDPNAVLEQSIRNSWKDVYELKGDRNDNRTNASGTTRTEPKTKLQLAIEATERARAAREQREQGPA